MSQRVLQAQHPAFPFMPCPSRPVLQPQHNSLAMSVFSVCFPELKMQHNHHAERRLLLWQSLATASSGPTLGSRSRSAASTGLATTWHAPWWTALVTAAPTPRATSPQLSTSSSALVAEEKINSARAVLPAFAWGTDVVCHMCSSPDNCLRALSVPPFPAARLLGFNTIRLPFRYRDLDQFWPKDYVSVGRAEQSASTHNNRAQLGRLVPAQHGMPQTAVLKLLCVGCFRACRAASAGRCLRRTCAAA